MILVSQDSIVFLSYVHAIVLAENRVLHVSISKGITSVDLLLVTIEESVRKLEDLQNQNRPSETLHSRCPLHSSAVLVLVHDTTTTSMFFRHTSSSAEPFLVRNTLTYNFSAWPLSSPRDYDPHCIVSTCHPYWEPHLCTL